MIKEDKKPFVQMSDDMDVKSFGISDTGFILDILRNKLYSDIIAAITREISCNARDAHREAGKRNVPIEITLPNYVEPYFKVQDFGTGISPERIADIFVNYGKSTKRDSNDYVGFYGLGSKTPFGYSNTFNIITIFDGTRYNYAAVIDETKVGKLIKLSENPTKEGNGTTIILAVKSNDFDKFQKDALSATHHWDVRPIFHGGKSPSFVEKQQILFGSDWVIEKSNHHVFNDDKFSADIDGIIYPINIYDIYPNDNKSLNAVFQLRQNLRLKFKVGELSVSANRETIYLDNETIEAIKNKLIKVNADILLAFQEKVNACSDYWSAQHFINHDTIFFNSASIFANLTFLGSKINFNNGAMPCPILHFVREWKDEVSNTFTLRQVKRRVLDFCKEKNLYINDFDSNHINTKDVRKHFEKDKSLNLIQVIMPTKNPNSDIKTLEEKFNLHLLAPENLSKLLEKPSKKINLSGPKFSLFKFGRGAKESRFFKEPQSSLKNDKRTKVLVKIETQKNNFSAEHFYFEDKLFPIQKFNVIANNFLEFSFYAIENAENKKIETLGFDITFEDFIKDNILSKVDQNKYFDAFQRKQDRSYIKNQLSSLQETIADNVMLFDKNSIARKTLEHICELKNSEVNLCGLYQIYYLLKKESIETEYEHFLINNKGKYLKDIQKEFYKKYPMFNYLDAYGIKYEAKVGFRQDAISYINQIDAQG